MSKMSVAEVVEKIQAVEGKINRFSKKSFKEILKALANDTEFVTRVASVKGDELTGVDEILVGKGFREFLKSVVESAGVDKSESERVLTPDFEIKSVEGLYEFISEAIYLYIDSGNRFEFLPKEDFKGSITLKAVDKSTKTAEAISPQTRESLGVYETTKEKHKALSVKSSCPSFLTKRKKV